MTPQTTFANGVNPWTGATPSENISRPRPAAPPPLQLPGAPAPQPVPATQGSVYRTRSGKLVKIDKAPRGQLLQGFEVHSPSLRHEWQPSGRWRRYKTDTGMDLMEVISRRPRNPSPPKYAASYPRLFQLQITGVCCPVPESELLKVYKSLKKFTRAKGYPYAQLRRSGVEGWIMIESLGPKEH